MKGMMRVFAVCGLLIGMLATAGPVAADQSDGMIYVGASVDYATPRQYTTEVVRVSVNWDDYGTPTPGASVCTVWHYRTTDTTPPCVYTNYNGDAAITHYISGASRGYLVSIDITVDAGWGPTQIDPVSFTPV